MQYNLVLLQCMRFKGRITSDLLADASGLGQPEVTEHLHHLVEAGHCQEAAGRYRLSPAGRGYLNGLLELERGAVDRAAMSDLYDAFVPVNSEYKFLIHAWQMRGGALNDHADADYDADVLDQIRDLHTNFLPLLDRMVAVAPRLNLYRARLAGSLEKVGSGDTSWLTKPLVDSHHTVWFELHEELIAMAGHSRRDEAQAGRAD